MLCAGGEEADTVANKYSGAHPARVLSLEVLVASSLEGRVAEHDDGRSLPLAEVVRVGLREATSGIVVVLLLLRDRAGGRACARWCMNQPPIYGIHSVVETEACGPVNTERSRLSSTNTSATAWSLRNRTSPSKKFK